MPFTFDKTADTLLQSELEAFLEALDIANVSDKNLAKYWKAIAIAAIQCGWVTFGDNAAPDLSSDPNSLPPKTIRNIAYRADKLYREVTTVDPLP